MPRAAPRRSSRPCGGPARGAWLALALLAAGAVAPASAQTITGAAYADPTTRYAHGILGDAVEWGTLDLTLSDGSRRRIVLPRSRVFEDTHPRLADVDFDGDAEVIVVETEVTLGARLSIYDETGLVAATPHIGRSNRWLAPVGAADLDGDGSVEIAYIDRPHLARTLRVWRYSDATLTEVANRDGLTNHRIGDSEIVGGLRTCDGQIEMITMDAAWARVIATRFENGALASRVVSETADADAMTQVLDCDR